MGGRDARSHAPAEHEPAGTRLVVLPSHDGLRLDQFLAAATELSRRAARRMIDEGVVARNGHPTRVQGRGLEWGDVVDIARPPTDLGVASRPVLPDVPVLAHDRWLHAVAKPAGMLSQPSSRGDDELALDQLAVLTAAAELGSRPYLRLVHRLDRLTSGVALFAANPQAHAPLVRAWERGRVERRYLAVVEGEPDDDTTLLDRPIGRDRDHDWRFRVTDGGREARTEVRVVRRLDSGLTVVECRLLTGRTHQVRVHLSDWGHPVVGDRLYGSRRSELASRPLLHAVSLALPHPKDGAEVRIEAPLPDDLRAFVGENPAA
jgi:23S rRNA pseudouridine1911/1915/1917 synthase